VTRLAIAFAVFVAMLFPAAAQAQQGLQVRETRFDLTLSDGRRLDSEGLVGALMEIQEEDGRVIAARLDGVEPAREDPSILLHRFSVRDPATGRWASLCQPDAAGRQAGFPVAGRWDGKGGYVSDPDTWFLTCTSGSQGKCILWGYNPFRKAANGADLAPFYQACQHMVRADYDGRGTAFTRNGTGIDTADIAGVQVHDTIDDPAWSFEAGWGPDGAVCVAHTRWENLLPTRVLLESQPQLAAAPCDEAEARRRGALLFNRSK
jgi:hypothetical protein